MHSGLVCIKFNILSFCSGPVPGDFICVHSAVMSIKLNISFSSGQDQCGEIFHACTEQ